MLYEVPITSNQEKQHTHQEFLKTWPLERVERMTLDEYTSAGNTDTFTYWIESRLDKLGSIWGGSAFKFGIYARSNVSEKGSKSGRTYTDTHAWYSKYGSTAAEAFTTVKGLIFQVIRAVREKDTTRIEATDLGPAFKWKIAFHYQDPADPVVLNIFSWDALAYLANLKRGQSLDRSVIYRQLLAQKPTDLLVDDYSSQLWEKWTAHVAEKPKLDVVKPGTGQPDSVKLTVPYTKQDALAELFISETDLDYIVDALNLKKNLILQGPPGVGKTFIAKRLAYMVIGARDEKRVEMIQFHQSYAYEDFIQGYRPDGDGRFALKDGIFHQFCRQAQANPDNMCFFVIDEINRANLSKVFGEVMMLIEADKRGAEFAVPLTYSRSAQDRFFIPSNLYLIGTMNTADRSLAMVDYALRRRFAFYDLKPEFNSVKFSETLTLAGVSKQLIDKIVTRMNALNAGIAEDEKNLGPGYMIGHSFFCPSGERETLDEDWYRMVILAEVAPLLREYWFDKPKKAEAEIGGLLS